MLSTTSRDYVSCLNKKLLEELKELLILENLKKCELDLAKHSFVDIGHVINGPLTMACAY